MFWTSARVVFTWVVLLVGCTPAEDPSGITAKDPQTQSVTQYDLARDTFQRGEPRKALAHALRALQLDEENADAAYLVSLIYLSFCEAGPNDCHLEDAARHARRALELRSDFRDARNILGVIYIHQKRYAAAIATLDPLAHDILYGSTHLAWGNLGWAYLEQGDADHAIPALRRAVAAEPRFCVGHYRLGRAFRMKHDARAALEAFTRAVEADAPGCQGLQVAFLERAQCLQTLGQAQAAIVDLDRCVQLDKRTDAGRQCGALLRTLE